MERSFAVERIDVHLKLNNSRFFSYFDLNIVVDEVHFFHDFNCFCVRHALSNLDTRGTQLTKKKKIVIKRSIYQLQLKIE